MSPTKAKRFFWSVPVVGRVNISQFIPIIHIEELLHEGAQVTILIGDSHSQILGDKSHNHKERCEIYKIVLRFMIERVIKNVGNIEIVLASELQSSADYMLDFYQVGGSTREDKAILASLGSIKAIKNPTLGGLIYPIIRTVDAKYVGATGHLVMDSESKIADFMDTEAYRINGQPLERLEYSLIDGLSAKKASNISEDDDQVDVLDKPDKIKKKLNKAFCEPGNVLENGILPILEKIIFPVFKSFEVHRAAESGGDMIFKSYAEVKNAYLEQKIHPKDLKESIIPKVVDLLANIQDYVQSNPEFQDLVDLAFPLKVNKRPAKIVPIRAPMSIEQLSLDSSMQNLSSEDKMLIISRGLNEILQRDTVETTLKTRNLRIYWGSATTGRPHVAYFVPMSKIADFLRADCEVTILLADLHGYLDSQKAPWELLDARTKYYQHIIISMLKSINVSIDKLRFVRGTDYELSNDFSKDLFRLISQTTLHDAKKAGAEVVKQTSDPLVGSILYPLLQALDEEYLGCDAQFGGVDQRKIFTYAEKYLPQVGYAKRAHLMNPMVPGLTGGKMSSSEVESKIDLLDDEETVVNKLNLASCPKDNLAENGVLAFIEHVVLPLFGKLSVGSNMQEYDCLAKLVEDFVVGRISDVDLRAAAATYINKLLDPIRSEFKSQELQKLTQAAYPKN